MNRALPLVLLCNLGLVLPSCGTDNSGDTSGTPNDTSPGDSVPDDTGTDDSANPTVDAGNDIGNALPLYFNANGTAEFEDAINPAGDRDFFFVKPPVGTMMVAWVASYIYDEEVTPDGIIRLYDSTGTMLAEIDDFPLWSWGTDPGLFWQATDPDGYYVEVLDYSDWVSGSADAKGGPAYDYFFNVAEDDLAIYEWGADDDKAEADATYDEASASTSDDLSYTWWWFGDVAKGQPCPYQEFGEIEEPGDEDWWVIDIPEKAVGDFIDISFWDQYTGALDPILSFYDEDGTLLGQTREPAYTMGSLIWNDTGITVHLSHVGRYYMVVEDANGNGGAGAGYFYPLISYGPWYFESMEPWEVEPNDPIELANPLAMSEDTINGYDFSLFAGALDSASDPSDAWELLASDADGLEGKYLNVYVETVIHGSLLDGKITVYADAGDGSFTELASATEQPSKTSEDDPAIWDLQLDSDANIYIVVEHESGADSASVSHFYAGTITVSDDPQH